MTLRVNPNFKLPCTWMLTRICGCFYLVTVPRKGEATFHSFKPRG